MFRTLLTKVVLFSFLILSSCDDDFICEKGHGPIISNELEIDNFTGINVSEGINVYLKKGVEQTVVIEAQENLIKLLNRNVKKNIWKVGFRHCVNRHREINIYITVPSINDISVSGSGKVVLEDVFEEDEIRLDISGSGKISGECLSTKLKSSISGSGKLELSGKATESELEISGSGEMAAFQLVTKASRIKISGSGKARVYVEDELDVNITGSGNVKYKGNPTSVNLKITGSGKVEKQN